MRTLREMLFAEVILICILNRVRVHSVYIGFISRDKMKCIEVKKNKQPVALGDRTQAHRHRHL